MFDRTKISLIAEFCQNHNGDYDTLARMADAAAKAGATHGKMQTILANTIAFRPQFEEGLVQDGIVKSIKRPYRPEYERLKNLEITHKDTIRFVKLCGDLGLEPLTTCFVRSHVDAIADAGFRTVKVASYDCASFPMLRDLKRAFSKIIVSTGATYDDEIEHAASILTGSDFALLHCVTLYPTPLDQMHMRRMEFLRRFAPVVGFSDHSLVSRDGVLASKAAIALGAEIVERHFTILAPDQTRDGPVSMNPAQLAEIASFTKLSPEERLQSLDSEHPGWRIVLGESMRRLSDQELLNRDYYRGRFASPRKESESGTRMIFNWEETPVK